MLELRKYQIPLSGGNCFEYLQFLQLQATLLHLYQELFPTQWNNSITKLFQQSCAVAYTDRELEFLKLLNSWFPIEYYDDLEAIEERYEEIPIYPQNMSWWNEDFEQLSLVEQFIISLLGWGYDLEEWESVFCQIALLAAIEPYFQMEYPRVPMEITKLMLLLSEEAGENEILFHLSFQTGRWHLEVPAQIATPTSVMTLVSSIGSSYERALIEVHSHANMSSEFSETDNREETGFRIFAVLGKLKSRPSINARIGIYSHFYSIPASWVFELPPTLVEKG